MATALVDQAVVKFIRGPTSRTGPGPERKLVAPKPSGWKVSARSHRRVASSESVRGGVLSTLKQTSVRTPERG